ncbi:hypothetical protein B0J18DRAFT_216797 [Chaetomium sp. MPI-SDFR-AT-0129]|nr:hypothetical protein B0J18DRAFT_216797 [Chaetomium sp. MPI-SDFR-AT-0129]
MSLDQDTSNGNRTDNNNTGTMPTTEHGSSSPHTMLGDASPKEPAVASAPSPRPAVVPADPTADPGAAASDAEPDGPRKKREAKPCGVCGAQPGKYKCPRCAMPYCSVACNKQHKENHPPDAPKPEPTTTFTTANPNPNSTNTTPDDPYSILLDHRDTFTHLFTKYPSLAAELTRIQEKTLPPPLLPSSAPANNPNNTWSSNRHKSHPHHHNRNHNNTNNNTPQPWSRDIGLRRGAEALRRARTDPSDTGDGVREFCELVKLLLNRDREQRKLEGGERQGVNGIEKVRREVVAEERGLIERLLREEGG